MSPQHNNCYNQHADPQPVCLQLNLHSCKGMDIRKPENSFFSVATRSIEEVDELNNFEFCPSSPSIPPSSPPSIPPSPIHEPLPISSPPTRTKPTKSTMPAQSKLVLSGSDHFFFRLNKYVYHNHSSQGLEVLTLSLLPGYLHQRRISAPS